MRCVVSLILQNCCKKKLNIEYTLSIWCNWAIPCLDYCLKFSVLTVVISKIWIAWRGLTFWPFSYQACPHTELTIGTIVHSDNDLLRVLLQDHIRGLQVKFTRINGLMFLLYVVLLWSTLEIFCMIVFFFFSNLCTIDKSDYTICLYLLIISHHIKW